MKITENDKLIELIEYYVSSNNISMSLGDMFSEIIGNTFLDKKVIDVLKSRFHKDSKSILLSKYVEFWDLDLDNEEDEYIYENYIANAIEEIDINKYLNNPYYKNIKFKSIKDGNYSLVNDKYLPYELFPFKDLSFDEQSLVEKNSFSFFETEFSFPAINHKNVTWMSITPNEIETMEKAVNEASGDVVVYGLGLGYYPYMISLKENVKSITIIENDKSIISLFKKHILPQFNHQEKITIIESDAFEYMKKGNHYDYHFIDLWHDPYDGLELYLKSKRLEKEGNKYFYWLESGFIALLRRCMLSLIEEQLANTGEEHYKKALNFTDKVINEYYQKTKNLVINKEDQLRDLLSEKSLLKLIV